VFRLRLLFPGRYLIDGSRFQLEQLYLLHPHFLFNAFELVLVRYPPVEHVPTIVEIVERPEHQALVRIRVHGSIDGKPEGVLVKYPDRFGDVAFPTDQDGGLVDGEEFAAGNVAHTAVVSA